MRFRPYAIAVLAIFGNSSSKSVTANSIEEPSKKAVRDAEEALRDGPWWTRTTDLRGAWRRDRERVFPQFLEPVLSHAGLARKLRRPPSCADLACCRGRSAAGSGGGSRSDLGWQAGELRTLRRPARYG